MASVSPVGSFANTQSIAEWSSKLVFPVENSIRSQIPIWMKFYCYEFMNTMSQRALAYSRSTGGVAGAIGSYTTKEKMQIMIPAPTNFLTTTAHSYASVRTGMPDTPLPSIVSSTLEKIFPGATDAIQTGALKGKLLFDLIDQYTATITGLDSSFSDQVEQGFMSDSTYVPAGGSRTFEIKINMPCLSDLDSKAAGKIIRAFEALSLPTLRSALTAATTKYFHPPLWVFGIGPANSMKVDPDWSGYPQLSVLRTVSHRKTAFDTNSLSAFGYGGTYKPIAYTVSLIFQELEPAFRQTSPFRETGINILSRSAAIVTAGGSLNPTITGG